MHNRWLAYLSFATVGIIVFVFFALRLRPIPIPRVESSIEPGSLQQPTITYVNPAQGPSSAPVTIVVFSDFTCPACKSLATSLDIVKRTYPRDVQVVWKNMPNESSHPLATLAAIAAHCADRQGRFWDYHDELFNRQTYLDENQLFDISTGLNLNKEAFQSCLETQDTLPVVKKDFDEGVGLGIVATPTLYINGEQAVGALSSDDLIQRVKSVLNN